jgi:hypothetical protein
MARLFAQDSDSDESNNLPDLDCLNADLNEEDDPHSSHIDPVTVMGTRYVYSSQLGTGLSFPVEHRPDKVHMAYSLCLRPCS